MRLVLVFLFSPLFAFGADIRPSSLGLSLSGGTEQYRSTSFDANLGLGDTWRASLGLMGARSGSAGNSRELTLGADARWSAWSFRGKLKGGREPNEVSYFGGLLGASFDFSSLWGGELATVLGLSFERLRFTQALDVRNRALSRAFVQKAAGLSLIQDLGEALSVSIAFTKYTYDETAGTINRAVGSRRTFYGGSLDNFIVGFPERSTSLIIDWAFAQGWSVSPHVGSTKSVLNGTKTTNAGLSLNWQFSPSWNVGVDYTRSKPELEAKSDLVSLDLGYVW